MIISKRIPILLVLACIGFNLSAAELGNVRIPKDGKLGGRIVQAGTYQLEIDQTADQPYLRLIKNRNIIATDRAIVLPARGSGKTTVELTTVAGKELIRIRARHEQNWYFAYLDTSR